MAYSSAEIGATERVLFDADRPCIVGSNVARFRHEDPSNPRRWTSSGAGNGTDVSATGFDAAYGGDDHSHLQTKPNTTAATWYYHVNLASPSELDSLAIINHDLGTQGATVALQIDDFINFPAPITLATISPSDDKRIVELDLRDTGSNERRYSDVLFIRLEFTGVAIQPSFGELIIGRRRQLKVEPQSTWDPRNLRSDIARSVSNSGVITTYALKKGRRFASANLDAWESLYISDLETLYEDDTDYGTEPMLWVDTPSSAPEEAAWMLLERPELVGPIDGPFRRQFRFQMIEQGPHYQAQES